MATLTLAPSRAPRRPLALLVALTLVLGFLGALGNAAPAQAVGGSLSGVVTGDGGVGIAGVQVNIYRNGPSPVQATTDANGAYSFTNPTAGNYRQWFVPLNTSTYLR